MRARCACWLGLLVLSSRKKPLRAKVARRERHGHQELRGARKVITSFRASTKTSRRFFGLKKSEAK